jgi:hypothetical protein
MDPDGSVERDIRMENTELIRCKLDEFYRVRSNRSDSVAATAVDAYLQYRQQLSGEERGRFDNAILQGWSPERAVSMVEYTSNRDTAARDRNTMRSMTI